MVEKTQTEREDAFTELLAHSEILQGSYRGNDMMIIRTSPIDKFPFQFGVKKARLMVKYIKEIQEFAKRPIPATL